MRQWERGGECLPLPSISASFHCRASSRQRHAGKAVNLQHSPEGLYALETQLGRAARRYGCAPVESGRGQLKQLPCEASPQSGVRRITWGNAGCLSRLPLQNQTAPKYTGLTVERHYTGDPRASDGPGEGSQDARSCLGAEDGRQRLSHAALSR